MSLALCEHACRRWEKPSARTNVLPREVLFSLARARPPGATANSRPIRWTAPRILINRRARDVLTNVPGPGLRDIARWNRVRLVWSPLDRTPAPLLARHRRFRQLRLSASQWKALHRRLGEAGAGVPAFSTMRWT
jgi:hypothetical protein